MRPYISEMCNSVIDALEFIGTAVLFGLFVLLLLVANDYLGGYAVLGILAAFFVWCFLSSNLVERWRFVRRIARKVEHQIDRAIATSQDVYL